MAAVPPPRRLPPSADARFGAPTRRRGRLGGLAVGLLALAALLLPLAVAPVVAWHFLGSPIPASLPSLAALHHRLLSPDDGTIVLDAVRILFWLGWLVFAGCALCDAAAQVRRRPTVRLPGLGWMQAATGPLIAAVALLVTAAPGIAMAAEPSGVEMASHAVTASAASASAPATAAPASTTADAVPLYTVQAEDSLWTIAGRHLPATSSCPDPHLRWEEIFHLNRMELLHPDGRPFTDPDLINPGWQLRMPADAIGLPDQQSSPPPQAAAVAPSSPSVPHGSRATAPQPAGRQPADRGPTALPTAPWTPSTTQVPAAAPSGPAVDAPPASTPSASVPAPSPSDAAVAPTSPALPPSAAVSGPATPAPTTGAAHGPAASTAPTTSGSPSSGVPAGPSLDLARPSRAPADPSVSSARPPAVSAGPETAPSAQPSRPSPSRLPLELFGAGLAAAGLIWLLRRLRLRRQLAGDLGDVPPLPSPEAAAAEVAATAGADLDGARFLHLALLTVAAAAERDGHELPDLRLARLTASTLELAFAAPPAMAPPAPYVEIDDSHWSIGRDVGQDVLDPDGSLTDRMIAPYPGLTLLGYTTTTAAVAATRGYADSGYGTGMGGPSGHEPPDDPEGLGRAGEPDSDARSGSESSERTAVLVDLEQVRSVSVLGPPRHAADVLRFAALGLSTSGWATYLRLTLAGFADELPGSDAELVHTAPELAMVLAALEAQVVTQQARLDRGASSVLNARLDAAGPTPHLLLVADPPDDPDLADRLGALARPGPRAGVGILVAGAVEEPGLTITVDDDGLLRIPGEPAPVVGSLGHQEFSAVAEAIRTATAPSAHARIVTVTHPASVEADDGREDMDRSAEADAEEGSVSPESEAESSADWAFGGAGLALEDIGAPPETWASFPQTPDLSSEPSARDDATDSSRHGTPPAASSLDSVADSGDPLPADKTPPDDRPTFVGGSAADSPEPVDSPSRPALAPWDVVQPGVVPVSRAATPPVLVRLMGAVTVEGSGRTPASRSHLRTATEILAFLALHEGAVDRQDLIDALWPAGRLDAAGRPLPQPARRTLFAHISRARALAGTDPAGDPYLADVDPGDPLRLAGAVLTDYQLFCRLRDAAWDRAGDAAIAGLQAALDLVRGPLPKPDTTRPSGQGGWLWMSTTAAYHHMPPAVVEVAVRLAEAYLHAGDAARARDAVVKLLAFNEPEFVFDERLWQLRLLADFRLGGDEAAWATVGLLEAMLRERARYMDDEEYGQMSPELDRFIADLLNARPATASAS